MALLLPVKEGVSKGRSRRCQEKLEEAGAAVERKVNTLVLFLRNKRYSALAQESRMAGLFVLWLRGAEARGIAKYIWLRLINISYWEYSGFTHTQRRSVLKDFGKLPQVMIFHLCWRFSWSLTRVLRKSTR